MELAIGWIIRTDGHQTGTVARLSDPLPQPAVEQPFLAGVRYPAIVKVIGSDDVDRGAQADPEGRPNVELLAGTRFRVTRLGADDLSH
ncbi:MAG: hypothetical protein ACRDLS_05715 [Solirubrobacteraceae bacterium]